MPQKNRWLLVYYPKKGKHRPVGWFFNRQDAERQLAFLHRWIPDGNFSVMFDNDHDAHLLSEITVPKTLYPTLH